MLLTESIWKIGACVHLSAAWFFSLILAGNLKFQLAPTLNLFLSVKQKRAMTLASFWQSSPSFRKWLSSELSYHGERSALNLLCTCEEILSFLGSTDFLVWFLLEALSKVSTSQSVCNKNMSYFINVWNL